MDVNKLKIIHFAEIVIIFVTIPLLYYFNLISSLKFIPLALVFVYCLFILIRDKSFDRKIFGLNSFKKWSTFFIRFFLYTCLTIVCVIIFMGDIFSDVLRADPHKWLIIILLYPFLSALPQELIFRVFFFHRYKNLIYNQGILTIFNAMLFSFSHIIFNNWTALILTFVGSMLFSFTYKRSNSLLVVTLEHALYGGVILTVSLSRFFYIPIF